MGRYLSKVTLFPLSILALWGTLISARRVIVRQFNEADLAGLFIALLLVGVFVEINVFLADAWRVTRYNFLLVFPLLLLMAVYGLRCMSISMTSIAQNTFKRSQPLVYGVMTALAFLWFLSGLWPETVKAMAGEAQAPNQYDLGFEYVDEERAPGDSLLTIRPEAGYLFSDRLDYYANQITPRVTPGSSGWVDAYAGVPYIVDVEDLNRALGAQGNLWFVIDIGRLFERFEPAFTQQVLQRMAVMRSFGNVLVLREMEDSWPLAETGRSTLKVTMAGKLQLSGYTLEPLPAMPGETVHITLFWQADARLLQYKVFIHLRDSTGNTVAQADFVPLERMDREWRHRLVGQANSGFIRLGNALVIPSVLSPGEYTIWTGLYDANTLQRLPVTDDASGENAVLLGELTVSGEPAIDQ